MKLGLSLLFLIAFNISWTLDTHAQKLRKISGSVIDSVANPIADANIMLVAGKDTLHSVSDKAGKFGFQNIKAINFMLHISIIGHSSYTGSFNFEEKESHLRLDPLTLASKGVMLEEVVIRGRIQSVRLMQDTIEFNAAAYTVLEGDKVADLLKQLPGVEVDDEDNVTAMGKGMTKLRVNGKDFFTNDVKEFISKLPAHIVAKIQVIDDYGDEANFTGIKVGEPQKMLNIVTKPDMDKGVFSTVNFSGGTNNQIGLGLNANIWETKNQIGINGNLNRADNGAGQSEGISLMANYRKMLKEGSFGLSYGLNQHANDNESVLFIETVNTLGTIYNARENNGYSKGKNHNLNWDFQNNNQKNFFNASISLGYAEQSGINNSFSKQTGIIRQDLKNQSNSINQVPNINANFSWSKRINKKGKNVSFNMTMRNSQNKSTQELLSNILYYDPSTQFLVKDSLLNRMIDSKNNNLNLGGTITYTQPLKQPKDSLARRNLNASYSFSVGRTNNNVLTYVTDKLNNLHYVDSLSTQYESLFFTQNIGLNYSYSAKKINYFLGFSARPNTLIGSYQNLAVKVKNSQINYAPNFNFSYRPSPSKTISIRYNGSSSSPNQNQLQPVRNTQNLQNVIIGNPNLKPSFNHSIGLNFNNNELKSGRLLQLSLNATTTQNQIVSNVVLLRDTLNGLKQETRYENANGAYTLSGNYSYTVPLIKNKLNISFRGNLGYNNNIVFTDNVKFINKGLNFSQAASSSLTSKKVSINGGVMYGSNTNNYTLIKGNTRNVETWSFNLNSRATFLKQYKIGLNMDKRINTGYTLANSNPFLIGATLNRTFLKDKALSLNIQASDLLNQGNNLSRSVSGNSTIDSRTNQITRYFAFGLSYSPQRFGDRRK